MESNDPEVALAAILKQAFKDQLNIDKYQDFVVPQYDERHTGARRDHGNGRSNTSRIFIALGKKDNKGPRDIVDFITQETTLKGGEIDEVRVFDAFSFATIPNEEANILIAMHKKLAKGNKPLVTIAKDRDDERGGGGTRSGGFRRDGGGRSGGGRSGGYGGGGRSGGYGGGGDRNSDGGGTERKRFKR